MTRDSDLGYPLLALLRRRGGGRRGTGASGALVAWANRAVENGLDGPAVCMLAGESRPYYSSEVDERFAAVLDELGVPEPAGPGEVQDACLRVMCERIVQGSVDLREALEELARLAFDASSPATEPSPSDPWWLRWEDLLIDIEQMTLHGEPPVYVPTLRPNSVGEHVRQLARETLEQIPAPPWLGACLALGSSEGAFE